MEMISRMQFYWSSFFITHVHAHIYTHVHTISLYQHTLICIPSQFRPVICFVGASGLLSVTARCCATFLRKWNLRAYASRTLTHTNRHTATHTHAQPPSFDYASIAFHLHALLFHMQMTSATIWQTDKYMRYSNNNKEVELWRQTLLHNQIEAPAKLQRKFHSMKKIRYKFDQRAASC